MMQLFDTHLHYNLPPFVSNWREVHAQAKANGVTHAVVVGTTITSSIEAIAMATEISELFASVGVHPNDDQTADQTSALQQLETLLKPELIENKIVVAIGEIGLDYARLNSSKDSHQEKNRQQSLFRAQLQFAMTQNLPVILHCRDAHQDMFSILDELDPSHQHKLIFHCMSGTLLELEKALTYNSYISFAANITYPKSTELREMVVQTPLDRMLSETDAPYLPPQPFRGKVNNPEYIEHTVKLLAELKGEELDKVGAQLVENGMNCFRIQQ